MLCLLGGAVMLSACNGQEDIEELTEADQTEKTSVRAIRLKKDMKKGTILLANHIEIVDVEAAEDLPEGYVSVAADALDRKLTANMKAGDYVIADVLSKKVYVDKDDEKLEVDDSLARKLGYVVVTDYVEADTGEDLCDEIQKIINDNPRKTIYFPDGVYNISNPIKTSSNPEKAVSLHLSANAVIRAADVWRGRTEYMIQLGAIDETFGIDAAGTNYYIYGGVIDGNGKANALALEGGRETSIRNVNIKNAMNGLYITYNEEYSSNDSDTEWINIEGCGYAGSVGVIVDGLDNTLSNIRVSGFETGVKLTRPGNLMHNIYARFIPGEQMSYESSKGFDDTSGGNWYDACRADDFRVAFFALGGSMSLYNDCSALWSRQLGRQIAFETNGGLSATLTNMRADFFGNGDNAFLLTYADGGKGIVKYPMFDVDLAGNECYKRYLVGHVVWNN